MEKQYKVKVTVRAEQSLREISHYIAVDLMEPQTDGKIAANIDKRPSIHWICSLTVFILHRKNHGTVWAFIAW